MRHTLAVVIGSLLFGACRLLAPTPPALPPTSTPTPGDQPSVDMLTYHDNLGGFSIQRPATWQQVNNEGDPATFSLEAAAGTTLLEKYMQIDVTPYAAECRQLRYGTEAFASSNVTINGVEFFRESGAGLGAGTVYEWTGYSTLKGTTCITIIFVLHSANPGVYATEPPAFDPAAESEIFDVLISTFRFDQ